MAKRYKHLRIEEFSYKELKKIKNIYELEQNAELTFSDVIERLIHERIISKPFKLDQVFGDKKEN